MIGGLLKLAAFSVLVFALFIGSLTSGLFAKTGVFRWVDGFEGSRGTFFKGMFPATHEGTPWKFTEENMPDLHGHVTIVTGANVGLGYWSAYHLAKVHDNVILACRTPSKCEATATKLRAELGEGVLVTPMELDLSSFESIRAFAKTFSNNFSHLDSLILNAGVMIPPFMTTKEGLELQIGTNHFGHHLLTKLLLPMLEKGAQHAGVSTVVAVSSAAHYDSYPEGIRLSIEGINDEATYDRGKAYGQSKLANVLFAQELAKRVKDKNILVNSAHPGAVDTELGRHIKARIAAALGETAAQWIDDNIIPKAGRGLWYPKDAALTQVYLAVGEDITSTKTTGLYYHPIGRVTTPDPHTFNQTLQEGLWSLTEDFIASH